MADFASAEAQRRTWETMERIESALTARILQRPEALPESLKRRAKSWLPEPKRRSKRELVTITGDMKQLISEYNSSAALLHSSQLNSQSQALGATGDLENEKIAFEAALASISNSDLRAESLANIYQAGISDHGMGRFLSQFTADVDADSIFIDTEEYGRYVDLSAEFRLFSGLSSSSPVTYLDYLSIFADFSNPIVQDAKTKPGYQAYLGQLQRALQVFYEKTHPLGPELLDIESINALVSKETKNDLFCTYCNKLFATPAVFQSHLEGRKHKKNVLQTKESEQSSLSDQELPVANELLVSALANELKPAIDRTRSNIVRRQGLTIKERELEADALAETLQKENEAFSEPETETAGRSHPANPEVGKDQLGPDGTPIPSWLWKLNGLSIEFKCEVCGNAVYRGRKAFDRHFKEPLHINGLKMLGVEWSPVFGGISTISEVKALKARLETGPEFRSGDAETEDADGNVMTQKVYEDLKRQGIL